jgi:hypothetical protein
MPLITDRFPELQTSLAELVESHKTVEGEPLHLALVYDPCRQDDANQVFLFEVSENFGGDHINPEHRLFEIEFSGKQVFGAADRGRGLRLVMTSLAEFGEALREGWSGVQEIKSAIRTGAFEVLFRDDVGEKLLQQLRTAEGAE